MGRKSSSEDASEERGFKARVPEWAREREEGRWYGAPPAEGSPRPAKTEPAKTDAAKTDAAKTDAASKLIVVLPDEAEKGWAKARVLDSPGEAAALVETLVDGGIAPELVSIFSATQMAMNVAYRPVVQLKEGRRRR